MDDEDAPDPIVDGQIDLGALAAEFMLLGLDPYPRKPGVEFAPPSEQDAQDTPFARLADRAEGQLIRTTIGGDATGSSDADRVGRAERARPTVCVGRRSGYCPPRSGARAGALRAGCSLVWLTKSA